MAKVHIPKQWLLDVQAYIQKNHHLIGKFRVILDLTDFEYKWDGNYGNLINGYYSLITTFNSNRFQEIQVFDREGNMIKQFYPPES